MGGEFFPPEDKFCSPPQKKAGRESSQKACRHIAVVVSSPEFTHSCGMTEILC